MEKKKKDGQDAMVTAIVVLSATIAFIGGYVLSGDLKERFLRATDSDETTNMDGILVAGGTLSKGSTLGFNEKYVVSNEDKNYNILLGTYSGFSGSYVNLEYGNTKSQLKLTKNSYNENSTEEYLVSFPANVVDVHMTTFDLNPNLNTIFVLLENGKLDYILIEDALETGNYEPKGTLELENVVKFYEGTSCDNEENNCTKTAFAQTSDGKIYDLYNYINK